MHRYEPPKVQPAPAAPDNSKPPEPASAIASSAKPAPAPQKAAPAPQSALPPIAEGPTDHEDTAAWKAIKGSFLLANLPGSSLGKPTKKTTQ
jgi:hypothetical protein